MSSNNLLDFNDALVYDDDEDDGAYSMDTMPTSPVAPSSSSSSTSTSTSTSTTSSSQRSNTTISTNSSTATPPHSRTSSSTALNTAAEAFAAGFTPTLEQEIIKQLEEAAHETESLDFVDVFHLITSLVHAGLMPHTCTLTSIASRVIKALIQLARATTSHRIMSDVGNVLQIICEAFPPWRYATWFPGKLPTDWDELILPVINIVSNAPGAVAAPTRAPTTGRLSMTGAGPTDLTKLANNAMILQYFVFLFQGDFNHNQNNGRHDYLISKLLNAETTQRRRLELIIEALIRSTSCRQGHQSMQMFFEQVLHYCSLDDTPNTIVRTELIHRFFGIQGLDAVELFLSSFCNARQKAQLIDFILVHKYEFKPPVAKKDFGLSFKNVPPPSLEKIVSFIYCLEPYEQPTSSTKSKKAATARAKPKVTSNTDAVFVTLVFHMVHATLAITNLEELTNEFVKRTERFVQTWSRKCGTDVPALRLLEAQAQLCSAQLS